jgi:drug/metabolite transporter (DMT)-like permease
VKLAYEAGFSMAEVTGGQFIVGTLVIGGMALYSKRAILKGSQIVKLIAAGVPMGLTGIFYYQSLQTLDASLAIIFLFQFIWMGTLLEWLLETKIPSKEKLWSITILLIGSVLAAGVFSKGMSTFTYNGVIWACIAALMFAIFIYVSGTVGKDIPAIQKSAFVSGGGLLIVLILVQPNFNIGIPVLIELSPYVLMLGIFGVALPPLLFSIGMPHIGAGVGTILTASELPVAVILSTLVLTEPVSWSQWIGVIIILCGIAIGNRSNQQTTKRQSSLSV